MPLDLVVADLAGTTIATHGGVIEALREAVAGERAVPADEEMAALRGASKRAAVASLVPRGAHYQRRCDTAYARFRDALRRCWSASPPAQVPGARHVLERYRAAGVRVALVTGFDRELALDVLGRAAWPPAGYDALVCGDEVALGRPAPDQILRAMALTGTRDAARVLAVGDTVNDLEAAARAAVGWNVGVLTGAHDWFRLLRAPHTHLLPSIPDLESIVSCSGE
jgi:phosphonatase-like hydrolase